ncbi:adenylate/guanylate cyclase domain-containing protein [Sulfurimonas sp.]|nr:adenylate/guanylate cyclase domain-containing protein [Sulfurimonas sp.]
MKERILYVATVFFILIVTTFLYLYKVDPFEKFSLAFNDINFELQSKTPSKDVVFVAVDEPSVNVYGRWPWDRSVIAKGIEKLEEADVLLLDMIFSETSSKGDDKKLSNAIASVNNSVCGFFLRHNTTQYIGDKELEILSDSSLDLLQSQISEHSKPNFVHAPYAEMNIIPILESCTLSGSFSTLSSSDHLMRSYPISIYYKNLLYPSLAIQGLRLKLNKDIERIDDLHVSIGENIIGVDAKGFIRLNYYKKEQYEVISFLDVAQGTVKPEYFKGKIVIFGITDVGSSDVVSTPLGAMSGPLLHYTFISNLFQGHLIKEPKNITMIFIALMVLMPLMVVLIFKRVFYRVTLSLTSYIVVFAYIKYLFVYQMIYIDTFYPLLGLLISMVSVEVLAFSIQENSTKFLRNAFSSYLSSDLLNKLVENPKALELGGESKELSILFSDIRGFTNISESMSPSDLIKLLNRYFTPMTKSVMDNSGMLDKYIGDAVMAFFNAPVNVKEHADASCRSALDMIEKLKNLNIELESENIVPIHIGIGINTADVVVGNMGSDERFNYTVIGDGVNLASRIEGLTKNYGVEILITEFTAKKLNNTFIYREIEPVQVKGKDEAVLIYELMPINEKSKEIKIAYDNAMNSYKSGDFVEAEILFEKLIEDYDDNPSKYFLLHVQDKHPWGVNKMTTK